MSVCFRRKTASNVVKVDMMISNSQLITMSIVTMGKQQVPEILFFNPL